jgi:YrbI family 3-deoxy-D-manno-octulosonate 8-phosphate phosphatase
MGSLTAPEIDLIVYDFDGVMTDNRVLLLQDGTEGVFVNRGDGWGISMLRRQGVAQLIMSTETNPVVAARARKLDLEVMSGCADKAAALRAYCQEHGHDLSRVVFVGNDVNDLAAMQLVGHAVAPSDAHARVTAAASQVTEAAGGAGVIRELAGLILGESG